MPKARVYRHHALEHIRYAIAPCALGQVLMAANTGGICAVFLGDTAQQLEDELAQSFSDSVFELDEDGLATWFERLLAHIEQPLHSADLPLALCGTPYQMRIWQLLAQIPSGQTRTYAQLAKQAGSHPRAVARACASNVLALLIPCHRVIASDGSLSGYRWGTARKQARLNHEQQLTEAITARQ